MSMFDGEHKLKIDKPIRLIELFAGIGAQAKALERIGVPFEHYRICEFDKYAVKSYNAIHGTDFETSDIRTITANDLGIVDTDKYCYIMTYSFPCTDLSVAGKQMGMSKGTQTRSGLLWEVERLLKEMKELPQILLMENVPQVIGQKNIKDFADWIAFLDTLGYKSKWQVLNAKDFNVPQNRERCYMVSALGNYYYEFPCGKGCEKRLKDILETNVDKKYFLPQTLIDYYIKRNSEQKEKGNGFFFEPNDGSKIGKSILTRAGSRQSDNFVIDRIIVDGILDGGVYAKSNEQHKRVYSTAGLAPTQTAGGGGNLETKIIERPILVGGIGDIDFGKQNRQGDRVYSSNGIACALTAQPLGNAGGYSYLYETECKIRKLTPRECLRLMDFDNEDFDKIKAAGISDSQVYKQAGNSIVVAVLQAIFNQML